MVGASCTGHVMLWLIIRGVRRDRRMATAVAALLPLLRYGPFNPTLAIPGTSPDEEGGRRSGCSGCRPRCSPRTP
ncbi:hypothetical protein D7147_04540 [Micromonospora musae]|uniref:Uncharacterized protein n=1 Tax=Micromonospora musae TaxID=1894970 RepID=A0ABX9RHG8_9ACTN|nr:hypothetical protein D7147_04540 [Micromonospora musae]